VGVLKSQSATDIATIEVQPNALAFLLIKHLRIAVVALCEVDFRLNAPVLLRKRTRGRERTGERKGMREAIFIVHNFDAKYARAVLLFSCAHYR